MTYRLWVNEDRTILVRVWENGVCETAERDDQSMIWGPPVWLEEEHVPDLAG